MKSKNFVVGVLFGIFIPVLFSAVDCIQSWIAFLSIYPSKKINEANKNGVMADGCVSDDATCAIGFEMPDDDCSDL